ncbi:hypothetical protein BN1723_018537, partial [Verticillium longisporum]
LHHPVVTQLARTSADRPPGPLCRPSLRRLVPAEDPEETAAAVLRLLRRLHLHLWRPAAARV